MIKTYILEGTITASSSETKIDSKAIPSLTTWKILEIRPYIDATDKVKIYLSINTERFYEIDSAILNLFKLPLPANHEIGEGNTLYLTAENSDTSDHTVKVMLIVDETKRA